MSNLHPIFEGIFAPLIPATKRDVPCPTCGAVGDEPCIRGRKPIQRAGIEGAVWIRGEVLGRDHDSRVTANRLSVNAGPSDA